MLLAATFWTEQRFLAKHKRWLQLALDIYLPRLVGGREPYALNEVTT